MNKTKIYNGECDLAAFAFAYQNSDTHMFLTNTETYKHVVGKKDGKEVQYIWFKEENAG